MQTTFAVLNAREQMPGLTPMFCSEKCTNSFLLRDDLRQHVSSIVTSMAAPFHEETSNNDQAITTT